MARVKTRKPVTANILKQSLLQKDKYKTQLMRLWKTKKNVTKEIILYVNVSLSVQ